MLCLQEERLAPRPSRRLPRSARSPSLEPIAASVSGEIGCYKSANVITGYSATAGNTNLRVGVLASSGVWVNALNASWIHGGSLFAGQDWTAADVSSFFTDGLSGNEETCTAAANKCPTAPPPPPE